MISKTLLSSTYGKLRDDYYFVDFFTVFTDATLKLSKGEFIDTALTLAKLVWHDRKKRRATLSEVHYLHRVSQMYFQLDEVKDGEKWDARTHTIV
jgi:hypothetical protein